MEACLKVENLTKRYGAFTLDNISFELPRGAIMGLIGENGSGKTTTIKLILNMLRRDAGRVTVFGLDNIGDETRIREQIGVVLDDSHFHDNLRARDVAKILRSIFSTWDDRLFTDYLHRFLLPDDQQIKAYSKGMKVKLSIAAALAHKPRLLLLDEATSGLDPIVRNELLDLFLEFIQDEFHGILLSSHITSDLERVADYITFIHHGRVALSDSKDELLTRYGMLRCGAADFEKLDRGRIVGYRRGSFGYEVLVRDRREAARMAPGSVMDHVTLEDIMTFTVRGEQETRPRNNR